ncbi:hypothetical protein ACIQXW_08425 [Lysinibacillus sp. NPDC097162]|uniref:hypothetical protein n=1 Tax=Lysinibacillus sp. NPDC097162 TaxID=3364140 RepID=UPI003800924D
MKEDLFTAFIFIFPFLIIAITLWIRIIKVNSNIQVEQNKEIIELLKKNSQDKDEIKINE